MRHASWKSLKCNGVSLPHQYVIRNRGGTTWLSEDGHAWEDTFGNRILDADRCSIMFHGGPRSGQAQDGDGEAGRA